MDEIGEKCSTLKYPAWQALKDSKLFNISEIAKAIEWNQDFSQKGSFMVWEINMGVCPRLEFDNIMFINCLGYDFYIYGAFEFLCNSIANLWRHVWYHYNTLGYPVIIISKVIDISCNREEMFY